MSGLQLHQVLLKVRGSPACKSVSKSPGTFPAMIEL
jgi:hypothetical protein